MVSDEIHVQRVHEDEQVIVIRDINPQAPSHLLAIPRKHYSGIHLVPDTEQELFRHLCSAIKAVLQKEGIAKKGYRLVINSGTEAGQSVDHLHVHILSGRTMGWPPG